MKTTTSIIAQISHALSISTTHHAASLPEGVSIDDDIWDVSALHHYDGKRSVHFNNIENHELRSLCKACVVEARASNSIGIAAIKLRCNSFTYLSRVIGERNALSLNATDFVHAERLILDSKVIAPGTADRLVSDLGAASRWFSRHLGLRIEYQPHARKQPIHGRFGTDEGRADKLIPDTVIADILALRHHPEIDLRDQFFLNLYTVAVATGFRISEIFSLPADCLLRDEGALKIINYSSKDGKCAPRPIAPEFTEMVNTCITELQDMTKEPRALAEHLDNCSQLDWDRLLDHGDTEAIDVAMRIWATKWISAPHRRMLDSRKAYSRQWDKWFDIESLYEEFGSALKISKAIGISRELVADLRKQTASSERGIIFVRGDRPVSAKAFETDPRVCSLNAFVKDTKIHWKRIRHNTTINAVIQQAMEAQIFQREWMESKNSVEFLAPFNRQPMINLSCHKTGEVRLYTRDALCTIFENQLSTIKTNEDRVQNCTASMFNHWLAGLSRSIGNKSREDSIFNRFNIMDPRTSEIAKFTTHDIRHWLNTAYSEGGLSQDQMRIVFNRKNIQSNATYIQTSASDRSDRLREATRDGMVLGQHADTFNRLAEESPEDAEKYLAASTKFYNPMPHGLCTLNLALDACPHSLSCFSSNAGGENTGRACEHLIIDPNDKSQQQEIRRINKNAEHIIVFFENDAMTDAPQYRHFQEVKATTDAFLTRMDLK